MIFVINLWAFLCIFDLRNKLKPVSLCYNTDRHSLIKITP